MSGENERLYTREQMVKAGHCAWCRRRQDGTPTFFYDGINYWRLLGDKRYMIDGVWAPKVGWWHGPECSCPSCREVR
jgi:hypothetical protein